MDAKLIAIIDDELEMEDVYSLALENLIKAGMIKLHFFSEAKEYFAWSMFQKPDLLLCDINMPEISGPEVCEIIRQTEHSIQIYFVSGHGPQDYVETMNRLNISRYFTKPLNFSELTLNLKADLGLMAVNS